MKKRYIVFLLIGIIYYLFTRWSGYYIPCIFYKITGYVCPGCGISHLCGDLLSLRFDTAFLQNIGVSIIGVIYIIWLILRNGLRWTWCTTKREQQLFILFIVFLFVYGILRNVEGFEFLKPYYMQ